MIKREMRSSSMKYCIILIVTLLHVCVLPFKMGTYSTMQKNALKNPMTHNRQRLLLRKIDEEAEAMKVDKKRTRRDHGGKNVDNNGGLIGNKTSSSSSSSSSAENFVPPSNPAQTESGKQEVKAPEPDFTPSTFSFPPDVAGPDTSIDSSNSRLLKEPARTSVFADSNPFETDLSRVRVSRSDPLQQSIVPPEIVFFGEPRNPPPGEAARDSKYHGSLLYWARHATVAPRSSRDRLDFVFPRGIKHPESIKYRLSNPSSLTFAQILDAFSAVMDDLQAAKAFIDANIDLVPSKLFLRVLTGEKLMAQARNDLQRMDYLKNVRDKYMLAHDQVFFPLNIEVQKAETRVMTYLAREEMRDYAKQWDEVEMSLHFVTLLAARYTWDAQVLAVLDGIKEKVKDTVGYMRAGLEKDLMNREFRKPAITSEVYRNASIGIQINMPELYTKLRPEIQFVHEMWEMTTVGELQDFFGTFCLRTNSSADQIKERLKILEATLAGIQGNEYIPLRVRVQELYFSLCSPSEVEVADRWFMQYKKEGGGRFPTYEPDSIPAMIRFEQRIRDTGNAFSNFAVDVLKFPTDYTESLAGKRPRAAQVGKWLERDPNYGTPVAPGYEERLAAFREAYIVQTELRKQAESRMQTVVADRMSQQDKESIEEERRS